MSNDKLRYNSFINSYVSFEKRCKTTSVKQITLKTIFNLKNNSFN